MCAVDPVLGHLPLHHLPVLPGHRAALEEAPGLVLLQHVLALLGALLLLLVQALGGTIIDPGLALHTMSAERD